MKGLDSFWSKSLVILSISVMGSCYIFHHFINKKIVEADKKNKFDGKSNKYKKKETDWLKRSSDLITNDSQDTYDSGYSYSESEPSDNDDFKIKKSEKKVDTRDYRKLNLTDEEEECMFTYSFKEKLWKRNCSKIMKYGYPGTENVFFKQRFVLSYSFKHKQSLWVMEKLHKKSFHDNDFNMGRDSCSFTIDPDIPSMFSASNDDYKNSGYDRGHMAAFANHRHDPNDMCKTFFLSNVSPQIGHGFNRNIWEQLEAHVRHLRNNKYREVYVCTGILFLPSYNEQQKKMMITYSIIGKNRVSVPTHYFKIILGVTKNNEFEAESFILPNKNISNDIHLDRYRVSIEDVEKASGLIFFDKINREEIVEVDNEISVPRRK